MASGCGKAKEGFHARMNGVGVKVGAQEGTPKEHEHDLTLTSARIGTHIDQHGNQHAHPALLQTTMSDSLQTTQQANYAANATAHPS